MTGEEFAFLVRDQVSDAGKNPRYDGPKLARYATEGVRFIVKKHPEAMYRTEVTTDAPVVVKASDVGQPAYVFELTDNFTNALVDYVAMRLIMEDSEDSRNGQLAASHGALTTSEMS